MFLSVALRQLWYLTVCYIACLIRFILQNNRCLVFPHCVQNWSEKLTVKTPQNVHGASFLCSQQNSTTDSCASFPSLVFVQYMRLVLGNPRWENMFKKTDKLSWKNRWKLGVSFLVFFWVFKGNCGSRTTEYYHSV